MLGCCNRAIAAASVRKRKRSAWSAADPAQQHLEGDGPSQPEVAGLVDHSHPAAADLAQDLVVTDRRRPGLGPGRGRGGGMPHGRHHRVGQAVQGPGERLAARAVFEVFGDRIEEILRQVPEVKRGQLGLGNAFSRRTQSIPPAGSGRAVSEHSLSRMTQSISFAIIQLRPA